MEWTRDENNSARWAITIRGSMVVTIIVQGTPCPAADCLVMPLEMAGGACVQYCTSVGIFYCVCSSQTHVAMQLEDALKALAATKQDGEEELPGFFEDYADDLGDDEECDDVVEITEEELLRFLDDQLPPLAVRHQLQRHELQQDPLTRRCAVNCLPTSHWRSSHPLPSCTYSSSSSMGMSSTLPDCAAQHHHTTA